MMQAAEADGPRPVKGGCFTADDWVEGSAFA